MKRQTLKYNAFDALALVRTDIERQFETLSQQAPRILHLSLNEAEALAWDTGFPHLVFPLLAEEKAQRAEVWVNRQRRIRQDGDVLALAA